DPGQHHAAVQGIPVRGLVHVPEQGGPDPRQERPPAVPGPRARIESVRLLGALRPTLIDRYLVQEILPPTGLGLLLFAFILLLQQITLLTGILVSRGADLPTILRIFANLLPSIFSTTIPMAFLLGVLLAFGRLASDSEIVAFRASGVSGARLLRPVLALAT